MFAAIDAFEESYQHAAEYPRNLVKTDHFPHTLKTYSTRLNNESDTLFSTEAANKPGSVDVLESRTSQDDYTLDTVVGINGLHRKLFPDGFDSPKKDPHFRAFFLEAKDSRSSLRLTRPMFDRLMSYFQVSPDFLDFLFAFGHTLTPRDAHFSGFRSSTNLHIQGLDFSCTEIGRSGLGYRLCYNLKSVEPMPRRTELPYQIRATSMYHQFDLISGSSTWLTVKGSELIKTRIASALKVACPDLVDARAKGFAVSLMIHLVVCQWSSDYWRWYINFLDEQFSAASKPVLNAEIDPVRKREDDIQPLSRATTMITEPRKSRISDRVPAQGGQGLSMFEMITMPNNDGMDTRLPERSSDNSDLSKFANIQKMATIEERAAEANRVLKCNRETIKSIQSHYDRCWKSQSFPADVKTQCSSTFESFIDRLTSLMEESARHSLNLDSMLHRVEVRKNVLNNMFTHTSILESQRSAERAQQTAQNMEDISVVMYEIGSRTEQETVVMRIITVVTLFFLPATFICVSGDPKSELPWSSQTNAAETFLSTDVVQYSDDPSQGPARQVFSMDALKLFLELCVPLMTVTLLLSFACLKWIKAQTKKKYEELAKDFRRPERMV